MKNLNKIAVGVAMAISSVGASAGTFQAITSESVGVEASTSGTLVANIAGDAIELVTGTAYKANDRLTITVAGDAKFADSTYVLEQSTSGDLTEFLLTTATTAGATTIEFKAASDIPSGAIYVLSGSSVSGQAVSFSMPAKAAGAEIDLSASARDVIGSYDPYMAVELFQYANEFSATVTGIADGVIDVNESRELFTVADDEDEFEITLVQAANDNGVTLDDDDKVKIVLSGDMSGIDSIVAATGGSPAAATIDVAAGTASFSLSGSDVVAGGATTLTATVAGDEVLNTREFTIKADLDFEDETDKNLIAAATAAGEWTINGLQAKVSQLSLNTTGFISWLKVANDGAIDVEVYGDIIWTLADGTEGSVDGALLGTVDAGGVGTISEAAMLEAMGNPTQLADVHMTVTVTGQENVVHLIAEKKASDGRLSVPVYYNTAGGRNWLQ